MGIESTFNLSGRKALVTGSSRGIGAAIALGLAEQGADVIVHCAQNIDQARQIAQKAAAFGVQARAVQVDLATENASVQLFRAASDTLGWIDILVLNASVQIPRSWQAISRSDFDLQVTVNFRTSVELMQLALPTMKERRWGRVVTIGSIQQVRPHPDMLVYAACKCAQLGTVQNLARQLACHGVTINNVAPGVIDTDRNTEALTNPTYRQRVLVKIPAGYVGEPQDCVGAVLLLCSAAGRYITGLDLFVDGGMHLG